MSGPKQKKVLASLPGAGPEPIFESARFQSRFRVFTILFTVGATCALVTSDFGDRDHVFSGVNSLCHHLHLSSDYLMVSMTVMVMYDELTKCDRDGGLRLMFCEMVWQSGFDLDILMALRW